MRRKRNNKIFIWIIVIIAGFVIFKYINPETKFKQDISSIPPTDISNTNIETKNIHDTSAKYIDITATYPTTGVGAGIIESQIRSQIETFKKDNDFSSLSDDELEYQGFTIDRQYVLNIDYSNSHNDKLLTHRLDSYSFTGGAHGGNNVETYTFDSTGQQVNISDLFINPNTGLKNISSKVIAKIKSDPNYTEAISSEWFTDGTIPTAENYATFMINSVDIKIIFQQYQIAPYAYGNIEVSIPLSEIINDIKPEYR